MKKTHSSAPRKPDYTLRALTDKTRGIIGADLQFLLAIAAIIIAVSLLRGILWQHVINGYQKVGFGTANLGSSVGVSKAHDRAPEMMSTVSSPPSSTTNASGRSAAMSRT